MQVAENGGQMAEIGGHELCSVLPNRHIWRASDACNLKRIAV